MSNDISDALAEDALAGLQPKSEFDDMFGFELYAHQIMALKAMRKTMLVDGGRSFGFFMEMGTGKTLIACASAALLADEWDDLVYIGPTKLQRSFFKTLFRVCNTFNRTGGQVSGGVNVDELVFEPRDYDPLERAREAKPIYLNKRRRNLYFISVASTKLAQQLQAILNLNRRILLIIDEAHILSNRISKKLDKTKDRLQIVYHGLRTNPSLRILQLTGTPFANRVNSAVPMFNLLAPTPEITLIPERHSNMIAPIIDSIFEKPFGLAQQLFESRLADSFVAVSTPWADEKLNRLAINTHPVDFLSISEKHKEVYDAARLIETTQASRARVMQAMRGEEASGSDYRTTTRRILNLGKEVTGPKLSKDECELTRLREISPKWCLMVDRVLKKDNQIHAIYSDYIDEYGLTGLGYVLEQHGFSKWNGERGTALETKQMYAMATGSEDTDVLLRSFNTLENYEATRHNKGIRVLLFSAAAATGMTFLSVQNVHMSPVWNPSQRRQLIYRFTRIGSAMHLQQEERILNVYEYAAVISQPTPRLIDPTNRLLGKDGSSEEVAYIKDASTDFYMWRAMTDKGVENELMQDAVYSAAVNSGPSLRAESKQVKTILSNGLIPPHKLFTHTADDIISGSQEMTWRSAFSAYSESRNYGQLPEGTDVISVSVDGTNYDLDVNTGLVYYPRSDDVLVRDGTLVPFALIRELVYLNYEKNK